MGVEKLAGATAFDTGGWPDPAPDKDFKAFLILLRFRGFLSFSSDGLSVPLSSTLHSVLRQGFADVGERGGGEVARSGEAGIVASELQPSRKTCFPLVSSIRRKAVTAVHPECIFPSASSANLDKWESTS